MITTGLYSKNQVPIIKLLNLMKSKNTQKNQENMIFDICSWINLLLLPEIDDFLNGNFGLQITVMVGSRDLAADDQMKLHFVTTSFFFWPTHAIWLEQFWNFKISCLSKSTKNSFLGKCFSNPMLQQPIILYMDCGSPFGSPYYLLLFRKSSVWGCQSS